MPNSQDLKTHGLKITAPRLRILKLFEKHTGEHLSAEDIVQRVRESDEHISLATVYRVLHQFEEAKIIIRHRFEDDHSVYELNEGAHHDHIVCVKCQKVDEFVDPVIEERQTIIAEKLGYTITEHSMTLYGTCKSCSE